MPSTMRSQSSSPGIMSLLTPTIFFLAALSGSFLFSLKTHHSRHPRTRDLAQSTRSRGLDDEPEEEDVDPVSVSGSRQLVYDPGNDDDFLIVLDRPQFRTQFGVRSGAAVRGYPSYGGIYARHCTAVELDFLGLDRFHIAMRSLDQEEEDAHCNNMRRLGATWWESEDAYRRNAMDPDKSNDPVTFVGWPPGGGVWVLRTTHDDATARGIGRINNCHTMEERCRLIREMGGSFYENPREGLYLEF
ncbi:uncharacterized protein F4822DRAFT_413020 [Hypoxylon trugodes]|uniref:uncharacterized protein n=1 Tax=Hypoxylon trugodes TaxID=326681 RepID=UPI00218C90B1|nr:uncharacterized protein F4822DRAFT_413020 [Hypoxylon trugodes]KAI1385434.1 hypothetical protein F4822DRAFT_413020 [Hypoxylon trugodes]